MPGAPLRHRPSRTTDFRQTLCVDHPQDFVGKSGSVGQDRDLVRGEAEEMLLSTSASWICGQDWMREHNYEPVHYHPWAKAWF